MSPGNDDINGTVGNVTILQQERLQLNTDILLKFNWYRYLGYGICSCNEFVCSRTNQSYRNPRFVEYDNLDAILFSNRHW